MFDFPTGSVDVGKHQHAASPQPYGAPLTFLDDILLFSSWP